MAVGAETYICVDLPQSISDRVLALRRHHGDAFRAALPAEITVAGSSGVGPIHPAQDPRQVFARLDQIAAVTPPIEAVFGPVMRFPQTDIFVLTLRDRRPFDALHGRIVASDIQFRPIPYPFLPHCTLRSRSPVSEAEAAELLDTRISEPFVIDTMSVYALDRLPMTCLHRSLLRGK